MATATNSVLTPDIITKEALTILHNNIVFVRNVNRQYDNSNTLGGQKNSGAIRIRLPNKYVTNTGAALATGDTIDTVEKAVTLTVGTQRHVDTSFLTEELTNDIDTFSERILAPGISVLASMFDYNMMAMAYAGVGNSVGTQGTVPATAAVLLNAHKKMSHAATPMSQRCCTVDPAANAGLVDGLKGLFNAGNQISENYRSGLMADNQLGFREIAMSQSVPVHTNGTRLDTDTFAVDGDTIANGGTTIDVDGVNGTETLTAGEVFTIANCFSCNPETKQSTGELYQFVVGADATAAGNQWTITIANPIYAADAEGLQNVVGATAAAAVVDGSTVTFAGTASGTGPQNLAYHKDSFVVGTTDLEMPNGVHFSSRQVMDGISMRIVRQYRIDTDDIPCRIDILYGGVVARPETACRIWG